MLGVKARRSAWHLMVRVNVLLPGLYAWLTTVAHPAAQRAAGSAAQLTAYSALAALVLGALIVPHFPRWGRAFGVLCFVTLCVATWILLDPLIDVQRLNPVRACCGAIGWALFAFGWGSAPKPEAADEEEEDEAGSRPLPARSSLPRGAAPILALGVAGALAPLLVAWRVTRRDHALLAHGAAVVCAILVVTVAVRMALEREGRSLVLAPRLRLKSAMSSLSALAFVLAAGFVWLLLR